MKVASGVHSSDPREKYQLICDDLRNRAYYEMHGGIPVFKFDPPVSLSPSISFKYDPSHIDLILIELLATAHFIANSPDIRKLENEIRKELRIPVPDPIGGHPVIPTYIRKPFSMFEAICGLFKRIRKQPHTLSKFYMETRLDNIRLTVAAINGDYIQVE